MRRHPKHATTAPAARSRSADPPSPRSLIDLWVGERLRARRIELGRPLADVAAASGISISLLSQVERGLRCATPQVVRALCRTLRIAQHRLRDDGGRDAAASPDAAVVRAGRHPRLDRPASGIVKENLTPPAARAHGAIEMFRAVIAPGGSTGDTPFATQDNLTLGYVAHGEIALTLGARTYALRRGDSFFHRGSTLRRWRNTGAEPAVVFWSIGRIDDAARAHRLATAPPATRTPTPGTRTSSRRSPP